MNAVFNHGRFFLAACALLYLSACTAASGPVPIDPCPSWLGQVAPIYLHPDDSNRTKDRVVMLNEAGEAVGCW